MLVTRIKGRSFPAYWPMKVTNQRPALSPRADFHITGVDRWQGFERGLHFLGLGVKRNILGDLLRKVFLRAKPQLKKAACDRAFDGHHLGFIGLFGIENGRLGGSASHEFLQQDRDDWRTVGWGLLAAFRRREISAPATKGAHCAMQKRHIIFVDQIAAHVDPLRMEPK